MTTQDDAKMNEMKDRAALGQEIISKNKAQGEPGTKQPAHEDSRVSAEETVAVIEGMLESVSGVGTETRESSAARFESKSGNYPVPPAERTLGIKDQATQQLDIAAGHLNAARTAVTTQATSDAALLSDPRYERDQKIFEMGRTGQLGKVAPSELELILQQGLTPEQAETVPLSAEEQVEEDMQRLEAVETGNESGENGGTAIR